ncbi:hypothetical protein LINPERPRIM_LOCUS4193 [Linum perenne]
MLLFSFISFLAPNSQILSTCRRSLIMSAMASRRVRVHGFSTLLHPPRSFTSGRGRTQTITMAYRQSAASESYTKKAHLSAVRKKRLKLPTANNHSDQYHMMSEFLSLPEGVQSALNVKSADSFQVLDDSTYRLILPKVRLLSFNACPVMDLRVTTTAHDFVVEMLSFRFQGAKALERENDHLKGLMVFRILWFESFLELKVQIDITVEMVKLPLSLMPPAAIEIPVNLIMEAVVDNLTKELLQNVVEDYELWMRKQEMLR